MLKYVAADLGSELHYLPGAAALGVLVMAVCLLIGRASRRLLGYRMKSARMAATAITAAYLFIIISITLFEREPGSRDAVSLRLFETFGGPRSNAYAFENMLLFLPLGVLLAMFVRLLRNPLISLAAGALLSLGIETIQLMTKRGYFQVDDIMMNAAGTAVGCLLFLVCYGVWRLFCRLARFLS